MNCRLCCKNRGARPSPTAGIIKSMDPGNRSVEFQKGAQDNPEEHAEEHPQATGGQSFRKAHPFAYWLTVGPIAIMVGLLVVGMVWALVFFILLLAE